MKEPNKGIEPLSFTLVYYTLIFVKKAQRIVIHVSVPSKGAKPIFEKNSKVLISPSRHKSSELHT